MDAATRLHQRASTARRAAPLDERGAAVSLLDLVQGLLREIPGLISDRVELFSLELGRAGAAMAKIVALMVAVAILGITAWAALWVGVVMGLLSLGWHWSIALAVVIVANGAAVAWALARMRALASLLKLPATRRHLTLHSSVQAVAAQSLPVAVDAEHQRDPEPEEKSRHASPVADASR